MIQSIQMETRARNIIIISITSALIILVICLFVVPAYILSFEPDRKSGLFYMHLTNYARAEGDRAQALEYINLSLRYYPDNRSAIFIKSELKKK